MGVVPRASNFSPHLWNDARGKAQGSVLGRQEAARVRGASETPPLPGSGIAGFTCVLLCILLMCCMPSRCLLHVTMHHVFFRRMALDRQLGGVNDIIVKWVASAAAEAEEAAVLSAMQVMDLHIVARGGGPGPAVLLVWDGPAAEPCQAGSYKGVADALRDCAQDGFCSAVWACALADVGALSGALSLQARNIVWDVCMLGNVCMRGCGCIDPFSPCVGQWVPQHNLCLGLLCGVIGGPCASC